MASGSPMELSLVELTGELMAELVSAPELAVCTEGGRCHVTGLGTESDKTLFLFKMN